jgi:hypothetical protein
VTAAGVAELKKRLPGIYINSLLSTPPSAKRKP